MGIYFFQFNHQEIASGQIIPQCIIVCVWQKNGTEFS